MLKFLLFTFFILSLYAEEVSVFGAGDITSSSPYGLTKSEKEILENSKNIKKLRNIVTKLETSYDDTNQKLEGIESVYEMDSETINSLKKEIPNLKNMISISTQLHKKYDEQIDLNHKSILELTKKLENFINLQEENNKRILKTLTSTNILLNNINKRYVTKKQFDELVEYINNKKKNNSSSVKKMSDYQAFKYAKKLFEKNYLTKSMPYFKNLVSKNYKPAQSNFYLAEIYFYKKRYKDAIYHYKKSMMKNDQASYIPKLLLHSAMSFDNMKDKENAINFYSTLVDAYPETKEAQEASIRLKN